MREGRLQGKGHPLPQLLFCSLKPWEKIKGHNKQLLLSSTFTNYSHLAKLAFTNKDGFKVILVGVFIYNLFSF